MRTSAGAHVWWGIVGALAGVGTVGILTIGGPLLGLGLVMALIGLRVPTLRATGWPMVLVGAAIGPGYLAWLNHQGPGTVCTTEGTTLTCTDLWSPWPFVAVAGVLVAVGVYVAVNSSRAAQR
ncbi:hypothetical protein ACLM5J_18840 [Nocardioides sp. Bht2]|uniref:hypothetical protein n=1 Tax=Nocardioides sp. Bht2 TaxID=3392297 RepID=UPI0039B383C7